MPSILKQWVPIGIRLGFRWGSNGTCQKFFLGFNAVMQWDRWDPMGLDGTRSTTVSPIAVLQNGTRWDPIGTRMGLAKKIFLPLKSVMQWNRWDPMRLDGTPSTSFSPIAVLQNGTRWDPIGTRTGLAKKKFLPLKSCTQWDPMGPNGTQWDSFQKSFAHSSAAKWDSHTVWPL